MTSGIHNAHAHLDIPQIPWLPNAKRAIARRNSFFHSIFTSPTAFWKVHDLSTISLEFSCKVASSAGAADYNGMNFLLPISFHSLHGVDSV